MTPNKAAASILCVTTVLAANAAASAPLEVAASAPVHVAREREERWPLALVMRLSGGAASMRDVDGVWYGRAEFGLRLGDERGAFIHVHSAGLEGWGARGAALGGAMPLTGQLGYATRRWIVAAGGGVNVLSVDHVAGQTGFGAMSPIGTANAGMSLRPVHILADLRAQHRWQWRAPDRTIVMVGLSVDGVFPE